MTDSFVIKLSGKAELPNPLKIGHNFHVVLDGSIVSETISDNDDGSKTHYFQFRPVLVEAIDEKGERFRAKDTRSRSQQYRACLFRKWKNLDVKESFEDYYDRRMVELITNEWE